MVEKSRKRRIIVSKTINKKTKKLRNPDSRTKLRAKKAYNPKELIRTVEFPSEKARGEFPIPESFRPRRRRSRSAK